MQNTLSSYAVSIHQPLKHREDNYNKLLIVKIYIIIHITQNKKIMKEICKKKLLLRK